MGATIMGSSILTALIHIKGHAMMLCGKDSIVDKETGGILAVPEPVDKVDDDDEEEEENAQATSRTISSSINLGP